MVIYTRTPFGVRVFYKEQKMYFEIERFTGKLRELIELALKGGADNIDQIFSHLNKEADLKLTRYVDFALSVVENEEGIERMEYYLFNGTLIQRNYASLFFNRNGDYDLIDKANKMGLIDDLQAYVR
jgi:hypothetical protein